MDTQYDALKLENQLCFPLYAAARQVTNLYNPHFKPLGITYTEYIAFMVLWEHDGITVGDLGAQLYLNNSTLTPLLKRMEAAGYLIRKRSTEDARVVRLHLTDKGRAMRDRASDIPRQVGRCVPLSPEQAAQLYDLLHILLDNSSDKSL